MNAEDIMQRMMDIRSDFPDADDYPIRFQGGQGPVLRIEVCLTDNGMVRRREIVFHTGRY